jgi:hypothetical protein
MMTQIVWGRKKSKAIRTWPLRVWFPRHSLQGEPLKIDQRWELQFLNKNGLSTCINDAGQSGSMRFQLAILESQQSRIWDKISSSNLRALSKFCPTEDPTLCQMGSTTTFIWYGVGKLVSMYPMAEVIIELRPGFLVSVSLAYPSSIQFLVTSCLPFRRHQKIPRTLFLALKCVCSPL